MFSWQKLKRILLWRRGQSLNEILIGLTIGLILILAIVAVLAPALTSEFRNKNFQLAIDLAGELASRVSSLADNDWPSIYNLSKSPASFYILSSGGTLATSSGSEFTQLTVNNIVYERYFTLENVNRDSFGAINVSGIADLSTQKVNISV